MPDHLSLTLSAKGPAAAPETGRPEIRQWLAAPGRPPPDPPADCPCGPRSGGEAGQGREGVVEGGRRMPAEAASPRE